MKRYSNYYKRILCLLGIVLLLSSYAYAQDKSGAYWIDAKGGARLQGVDLPLNGETTLRLAVDIPAGKILKAYNITLVYDQNTVAVVKALTAPDAAMPPKYVNAANPGTLTFNGFDVSGVSGPASSSLIDLTLRGNKPGTFDLIIAPNSFGSSVADQFIPVAQTIRVNVR